MVKHPIVVAALALGPILAAVAQPVPGRGPAAPSPPPPAAMQGGAMPVQGIVARLLPNPRGEVDGLLLTDGRLLRFPPHMSAALMAVAGQGDAVTVDAIPERNSSDLRAWRIANRTSGREVTELPPPPPALPRAWSQRDMRVAGAIQRTLTGARGEVNGVILEDGTVVRFPPHVGADFADLLAAGRRLVAQGYGTSGPAGTAVEAVALGASESELLAVAPRGPR